ncbi:MAG: ABC transporter ATP-binding protein [Clostridia bacterium]|nr:ABC transporter ATP-binding protein [Clostridia bacterium]
MEQSDIKYYKMLGEIQVSIKQSKTFYDAIKNGLKIVTMNSASDYAVVWYKVNNSYKPYYWLMPYDLTSASISCDNNAINDCIKNNKVITYADFIKDADEELKNSFGSLNIASLVIAPFNFTKNEQGFIFYIKKEGKFSSDEVDSFQILTLLTEISIHDSNLTLNDWTKNKVILSCKDIKKSFKNGDVITNVLKGINFNIYEGEFLCFLGESGCGKSTLLNIIGGLEKLDSGSFEFYGKDYSKASDDELTKYRRDNIGFIFQSYNLMPNLTSKQNLDLIGELVDNPLDSMETLKIVGLEDKANNYPSQLSGGQQQRVSIARALIKNPKIIMADEPTAALDYDTSIEVLTTMEKVVSKGTSLVMVTHNEEITKMADRVIRFRNGKVYEITVNSNPLKAKDLVW